VEIWICELVMKGLLIDVECCHGNRDEAYCALCHVSFKPQENVFDIKILQTS
jgi:hypothetical protein